MKKRLRLHKYIANCGYTSRRRAELLILAGRVQVNGKVVDTLGHTMDSDRDEIVVNGDRVVPPPRETILFHKPTAVITSTHDTHDRLTVMDILPKRFRETGVFPVGRLDQNTEGLLILTNDGDLHHRITHPRHEIDKEYAADVRGRPTAPDLKRFESGIVLDGRKTAPAEVIGMERVTTAGAEEVSRVTVVIREGRKRQVRLMFEALGHPVLRLRRVRIGKLVLGDLPAGAWRKLGDEEIRSLLG